MTHPEARNHLSAFVTKMQNEGLPPLVIDTFAFYYKQILAGENGLVYDREIQPVQSHEIENFENLQKYSNAGQHVRDQAIRIVLNGGLGTTMGLTGPKSLIVAKKGKTFLEIILKQAENSGIRLALMNSFSTHAETQGALSKIQPARTPLQFIQHKFPKIRRQDLAPVTWPPDPQMEWNPPGHGDVFTALITSGMLDRLLAEGIQYAFIHNLDNLGARMDPSLLGYFAENRFAFMMEVAEKTPADIKGGHLARRRSGRLILREAAQCPKEERIAFQDITRYRFFNTNNIWINLESLKALFEKEETIRLPMILNPKTVNPRDENTPKAFQIETAMGSAISLFEETMAVNVPRSRFFPVKSCSDLMALRSDFYVLENDENLQINQQRASAKIPDSLTVRLDPKFYGRIDLLEERFKQGLPSLVDCESLSIAGDVYFEDDIIIKGRVSIKNRQKSPAVIKKGTVIDGDVTF
jgi:UTP--glucose-1-phosphate uridylyltransferase